jgi:hypothetical protein
MTGSSHEVVIEVNNSVCFYLLDYAAASHCYKNMKIIRGIMMVQISFLQTVLNKNLDCNLNALKLSRKRRTIDKRKSSIL